MGIWDLDLGGLGFVGLWGVKWRESGWVCGCGWSWYIYIYIYKYSSSQLETSSSVLVDYRTGYCSGHCMDLGVEVNMFVTL